MNKAWYRCCNCPVWTPLLSLCVSGTIYISECGTCGTWVIRSKFE